METLATCPVCGSQVSGKTTGLACGPFSGKATIHPSVPVYEYKCAPCEATWDDLSPAAEVEQLRLQAAASVAIQTEEIDPADLDGRVWLYKISGPDGRPFTYRIEVSGTALAAHPPAGFAGDEARLTRVVERKVRETVAQGLHEDLVLTASTRGWALRVAPEPLRKFIAS